MPLDARNQIAVLRDEKPLSLEKTMEETMTVEPHLHQGIVLLYIVQGCRMALFTREVLICDTVEGRNAAPVDIHIHTHIHIHFKNTYTFTFTFYIYIYNIYTY